MSLASLLAELTGIQTVPIGKRHCADDWVCGAGPKSTMAARIGAMRLCRNAADGSGKRAELRARCGSDEPAFLCCQQRQEAGRGDRDLRLFGSRVRGVAHRG